MKHVLVTIPLKEEKDQEMLRNAAPEYTFTFMEDWNTNPGYEEERKKANIMIGQPRVAYLKDAANLEWLQLGISGADRYTSDPEFPAHVMLTNMTGAFGHSISEYLLVMLLSLYKKMHLYRDQQKDRIWLDRGEEKTLAGKTVLIVGAGDIGTRFARLVSVFGTRIWGIRRVEREIPEGFERMETLDKLDELLPQADVVVLSLPSTPATRGLFDKERLERLKADAVLLNVGRGDAIVQEDLIEVLEAGHLYGVGLDVTVPEPLPQENPLWKMENVILTPHISGGSFEHLDETYRYILKMAAENLGRYAAGEELMNLVDMETGYRKL